MGNWYRERHKLLQLQFRIVTAGDTKNGSPFVGAGRDLVIVFSLLSLKGLLLCECGLTGMTVPDTPNNESHARFPPLQGAFRLARRNRSMGTEHAP